MNVSRIQPENTAVNTVKGEAGNIYFDDGGTGGVPVVFVHSFGGSTQHWAPQLEHLRRNRRAVALDIRGHGQSAAPASNDYNPGSIANDIAAVVDSLRLERFVIVGHSMGGSAAIAYAGKYPDKIAGLVVTGTPGKTPAEQAKPIIASLESDKYNKVMDDYMNQLLANAKPETDKLEREGMNKIPKEASLSIIKATFKYDPLPALNSYTGPKLIISRSGEEQPNSLHKAFPKIPYKTIEGTSHWMQLDKPNEFNKMLDEFLMQVDRS
jgi:pimeloyl-ACP methyl ester carboxylesterase